MNLRLLVFLILFLVPASATICQFLNHSFVSLHKIYCSDTKRDDDLSVCAATQKNPGTARYKTFTAAQKAVITGTALNPVYRYYFNATCDPDGKGVIGIEIYGLKLPLLNPLNQSAVNVPTAMFNQSEVPFDLEPALRLLSSNASVPLLRFVLGDVEQEIDFPQFSLQRTTIEEIFFDELKFLSGTFPTAKNWSKLQSLRIFNSPLVSGNISEHFTVLPNILIIDLHGCARVDIPHTWDPKDWNSAIREISLDSIPATLATTNTFARFKQLRIFSISDGYFFAGAIPDSHTYPAMTQLRISGVFTPAVIPEWNNTFSVLSLRNSRLSGTIPTTIKFSNVGNVFLDLAYNTLSGHVPPNLYSKDVSFSVLDLSYNLLSGDVSALTFNVTKKITIEQNGFDGFPPAIIGTPTIIDFSNNHFILPPRIGEKFPYTLPSTVVTLDLSENNLFEFPYAFFNNNRYPRLKFFYLQQNEIEWTHIHSNTNSKRNIDDTIANVVFDTKYQYYIYNRNQNATGNFTSYTKIPVNSNFNNGIIDISYNRIQGDYPFAFCSPYFITNATSTPAVFRYEVRMSYNRFTFNQRYLPLPDVFTKRDNNFLNEILVTSVLNPQDINECTEGTHECDHICSDGWFPLLSYTCACQPGFKFPNRRVPSPINPNFFVTVKDTLRCTVDTCGDGWRVGPPFGSEECDTQEVGCLGNCTVKPGFVCNATKSQTQCIDVISNYAPPNLTFRPGARKGEVCSEMHCGNICGDQYVVKGEDCEPAYQGKACTENCRAATGYQCCFKNAAGNLVCNRDEAVTYPADRIVCNEICGDGLIVGAETCEPPNITGCSSCRSMPGYKCTGKECVPICGDGIVLPPEECDPGNGSLGLGCNSRVCAVTPGYRCELDHNNSVRGGFKTLSCSAICGDGLVVSGEDCDGGRKNLLGCNDCRRMDGFECSNNICTAKCGDGLIVETEVCEPIYRGVAVVGCDMCVRAKRGYECNANTGKCPPKCGDGLFVAGEQCDNGERGCKNCLPEKGFECSNNVCKAICGDGYFVKGHEICEPSISNLGCNFDCTTRNGYRCDPVTGLCSTVCGDSLILGNETCEPSLATFGCEFNCTTKRGYTCDPVFSKTCSNICGDGLLVSPEICESALTIGCGTNCQAKPGYQCTPNTGICTNVCGDGLMVFPEVCETANDGRFVTGCSSNCSALPGYDCKSGMCKSVCGDGIVVDGEGCDTGANRDEGCRDCTVVLGYYCPHDRSQKCQECPRRDTYPEYPKPDFPFPSLQKYYDKGLLNETSLYSCSACDNGMQLFYSSYSRMVDTCANWNLDPKLRTQTCNFACANQSSISDSSAALVYLHSQLKKSIVRRDANGPGEFLAEIMHALFPSVKFNFTSSLKRAGPSFSLNLSDCSATSQEAMRVIRGMISDIVPNAPLDITNDTVTCSMEVSTVRAPAAVDVAKPIIITIVCGILLVVIVITLVVLYVYYARHILHQLPPEVNWSYLHRVTHPWSWKSKDGYYVREYAPSSPEWAKVMQLVDGFFQCNRALDFSNIYAVYNASLIRGFVTQFNIISMRKLVSGGVFFQHSFQYHKHPKKVWVNEQFDERVNSLEWNKRLPVPILPSVHGTDLLVAEKIAETGFALLSSLDAGYYGKGIYFTSYMLYVLPYACGKRTPAVIVSYLIPGHTYPTTENYKGEKSLVGQPLKNGYNSHYVITARNGNVLNQSDAENKTVGRYCDEIVIGQESQICPAFILKINLNEKLQRTLDKWTIESEAYEEKAQTARVKRISDTQRTGERELIPSHSFIDKETLGSMYDDDSMSVTQGLTMSSSMSSSVGYPQNMSGTTDGYLPRQSKGHVTIVLPQASDYERNGVVYSGDGDGEEYYQLL